VECRAGPEGDGPNLAIGLLDLSREGAGLLAGAPLDPGHVVVLGIQGPDMGAALRLPGLVAWCATAAQPACWRLGVQFAHPLSYATLNDLA
jgi:hypothetical protein